MYELYKIVNVILEWLNDSQNNNHEWFYLKN